MTDTTNAGPVLPELSGQPRMQIALFDEQGNGADDRVLDYGRQCAENVAGPLIEANASLRERVAELERELGEFRYGAGACAVALAESTAELDRLRAECEALRAMLDGASKTRAPKPRTLAQRGTGALHGEQQHCFEMGYREGAAAVRKAIAAKIDAARAENEALRADAERYRYALDNDLLWEQRDMNGCSDGCCGGCSYRRTETPAIDAARAAGEGK